MSYEYGQNRIEQPTQQQLIQPITTGLSNVYESLHELRLNLDARMESMFRDVAMQLGEPRAAVMQEIEQRLRKACQQQYEIELFTQAKIEALLSGVSGMMSTIESALAKHNKRLEKLKRPGITGTADATLGERPGTVPQTQPGKSPPGTAIPGTVNVPGSFLNQFEVFPPPPSANDIATLVIPMQGNSGYIGIGNLPSEMWNIDNSVGWFLTLVPTPLTRVEIPIQVDANGQFQDAGKLYVNVNVNMPIAELQSLMAQFPIEQTTINYLSSQEAWDASTAIYSEPVTRSVWEVFNLTPPVVQQAPPRMPSLREMARAAPSSPADASGTTPVSTQPLAPNGAQEGQNDCPPPPCPEIQFTGITDALRGFLPDLRVPSFEAVCEQLNPVYTYLGFPQEVRPPCTNLADLRRYLEGRLNGG